MHYELHGPTPTGWTWNPGVALGLFRKGRKEILAGFHCWPEETVVVEMGGQRRQTSPRERISQANRSRQPSV